LAAAWGLSKKSQENRKRSLGRGSATNFVFDKITQNGLKKPVSDFLFACQPLELTADGRSSQIRDFLDSPCEFELTRERCYLKICRQRVRA